MHAIDQDEKVENWQEEYREDVERVPIEIDLEPAQEKEIVQPALNEKSDYLATYNKTWRIQKLFGGKLWIGNKYDRCSQGIVIVGSNFLMWHFYCMFITNDKEPHPVHATLFFALYVSLIYFIARCMCTEPGVLPRGNLEAPATSLAKKSAKNEHDSQCAQQSPDKARSTHSTHAQLGAAKGTRDANANADSSDSSDSDHEYTPATQSTQHSGGAKRAKSGGSGGSSKDNGKFSRLPQSDHFRDEEQSMNASRATSATSGNTSAINEVNGNAAANAHAGSGSGTDFADKKFDADIDLYKERYCSTCKIMRPPKASHCNRCNHCVKLFDHHCYFIGNCVGVRNYKDFLGFLFVSYVACVYLVIFSLSHIVSLFADDEIRSYTAQQYKEYKKTRALFFLFLFFSVCACLICHKRVSHSVSRFFLLIATVFACEINNWHDAYARQVLAPCVQIAFTFAGASAVTPLFFSTLSNVMRGATEKEVHALHTHSMKCDHRMPRLSWKDRFSNLRDFCKMTVPESEIKGGYVV